MCDLSRRKAWTLYAGERSIFIKKPIGLFRGKYKTPDYTSLSYKYNAYFKRIMVCRYRRCSYPFFLRDIILLYARFCCLYHKLNIKIKIPERIRFIVKHEISKMYLFIH